MGTANRVQLATVRETTLGTTPNTPRMRGARFTGESLAFNQTFVDSNEIRSDRMVVDPIKTMAASQGAINIELSYPVDNSPESDMLRSAFYNTWNNAPAFDNDGTADSVITDAGTVANTYAVTRVAPRSSSATWCARPASPTRLTTRPLASAWRAPRPPPSSERPFR
jgi:hypothetical protein